MFSFSIDHLRYMMFHGKPGKQVHGYGQFMLMIVNYIFIGSIDDRDICTVQKQI